jgi:hypothetical protein
MLGTRVERGKDRISQAHRHHRAGPATDGLAAATTQLREWCARSWPPPTGGRKGRSWVTTAGTAFDCGGGSRLLARVARASGVSSPASRHPLRRTFRALD